MNILESSSDSPDGDTVGNKLIIPFFSIAVYSIGLGSLLLELSELTVFLLAWSENLILQFGPAASTFS